MRQLIVGLVLMVSSLSGTNIGRFYVEADYLLWSASQDGLSPCQETMVDVDSSGPITLTSDSQRLNHQWDSGVRAALGYVPRCGMGDIRLTYTYFASRLNSHPLERMLTLPPDQFAPMGTFIFNNYVGNEITLENAFGLNSPYGNKAEWKLNFNQFDLDVGESFKICRRLTLRPVIGLRYLNTRQYFKQDITTPIQVTQRGNQVSSQSIFTATCPFIGGGVKGALDSRLYLGKGFELCGSIGGAMLWGRFKVLQNYAAYTSQYPFPPDTLLVEEKLLNQVYTSILNLDLGLGLSWSHWIGCGCRHLLTLKFAWEQHLYTKMNQLQSMVASARFLSELASITTVQTAVLDQNTQHGDLSLQGFVFSVSFTY